MARLGNKKNFKGLVGNVVFREQNGKQIVQSRATNIRQTEATKKSASEFGNCSLWAKKLRIGLKPFLVELTDSTMHQRLTSAIYTGIKTNLNQPIGMRTPLNSNMENLVGFDFNSHSPFETSFKLPITAELTATNEAQITLPAFTPSEVMIFPDGCTTAELVLFVYATNFVDNAQTNSFYTSIPIEKNMSIPTATVWTTPTLPNNYFILTSAKLLFYNPNPLTVRNYLNSKTFSPAMVVMAKTVGG